MLVKWPTSAWWRPCDYITSVGLCVCLSDGASWVAGWHDVDGRWCHMRGHVQRRDWLLYVRVGQLGECLVVGRNVGLLSEGRMVQWLIWWGSHWVSHAWWCQIWCRWCHTASRSSGGEFRFDVDGATSTLAGIFTFLVLFAFLKNKLKNINNIFKK